ncbi:MAG: hypothetical protein M4D80_25950 [Myxococcota bacterium]|nr:hypothetical protein [Myxococcota bacterium]
MGEDLRAIHSSTEERYFHCRGCGAKGEVQFRAWGDSGWQTGALILEVEADDVLVRAEEDLMADADRVLHLIKCPTCKQRDPAYVRWVYARVIGWFALAGFFAWVGNIMVPYRITLYITAIVCGLGGVWQITRERSRYKRAASARILRLKPGKHPGLAQPASIAPIVTTAPPPIAQREAGEEPAYLRKD